MILVGLGQMPVPPIPNSARANAQTFPNSRTHLQKSTMPNETLLFIKIIIILSLLSYIIKYKVNANYKNGEKYNNHKISAKLTHRHSHIHIHIYNQIQILQTQIL